MSAARLFRLGERAFILAMTAFFLLPFLWLATAAYKPSRDMFSVPPTLLFRPTFEQFATVLRLFDVSSLLSSSLLIAAGSVGLSLLLGVPAGYALARSSSRHATAAAYFFMAVRMVPAVAALIPFYLMMRDIGLLGSWVSVVLINSMLNSAFVTWMMFLYFRGLPKELEEAALTDGCTMLGAFWRAALPAVRSGVVASALFCLIFSWNDFLYPMFLTRLEFQAAVGRAPGGFWDEGHHLGRAGRARPLLDDPNRSDRAGPQPLFRSGTDQGHSLSRMIGASVPRVVSVVASNKWMRAGSATSESRAPCSDALRTVHEHPQPV